MQPRMKKIIIAIAAIVFLLVLVILLIPMNNSVTVAYRTATRHTLAQLGEGLTAFREDFGDYPPGDSVHMAARPYGYQNLAHYLLGPEGKGWGAPAGGAMPFGGKSEKAFGPYFEGESGGSGKDPAEGVCDAFQPSMPILYFRAEPTEDPVFDASDNPLDPTGRTGFASQAQFEMLVRRADGSWVRDDYLLISAGADRVFGQVVEDEATGNLRPARPEEDEKAWCDDVTNFAR